MGIVTTPELTKLSSSFTLEILMILDMYFLNKLGVIKIRGDEGTKTRSIYC